MIKHFYTSTRDNSIHSSASDAILQGLSREGGLFVDPNLEQIHIDLQTICNQSYNENALMILSELLPDYRKEDLKAAIEKAYADFPIPVRQVGNVHVLELYHGPTSAFKDAALMLLPQFISLSLKDKNQKALILTATSGDTGKAALNGFADVENTHIVVFYPHEKVSQIQYRQMATQIGDNVSVFAVKGTFDDCQNGVKEIFTDPQVQQWAKDNHLYLSSANSINIGRLIPQIVYYFEAYSQLVNKGVIQINDEITFSVPTGNFGDVLAGYYAYKMGLPVKRFIVASDENRVLTDFIETGTYNRKRPFIQTISPSMDILVSSNLERLLYDLADKDDHKIAAYMKSLKESGEFTIDQEMLKKLQQKFVAVCIDQNETRKTINDVFTKYQYLLDTHSAIAYRAAETIKDTPVVSLSTASPYKFSKDVLLSLNIKEDDEFQAMENLHKLSGMPIGVNLSKLQSMEIRHKEIIEKTEMKDKVEELFK